MDEQIIKKTCGTCLGLFVFGGILIWSISTFVFGNGFKQEAVVENITYTHIFEGRLPGDQKQVIVSGGSYGFGSLLADAETSFDHAAWNSGFNLNGNEFDGLITAAGSLLDGLKGVVGGFFDEAGNWIAYSGEEGSYGFGSLGDDDDDDDDDDNGLSDGENGSDGSEDEDNESETSSGSGSDGNGQGDASGTDSSDDYSTSGSNDGSDSGSGDSEEGDVDLVFEQSTDYMSGRTDSNCHVGAQYYDGETSITFSDSSFGITFEFRTNPEWKPGRSAPYYQIIEGAERSVRFGPIGSITGCSMPQYYMMKEAKARSASELMADLEKATHEDFEAYQDTINGLVVVIYQDWGLCKHPTIQVIGGSKNYEFYPVCGNADELGSLIEIISSASL
jgi:hypothetical protein